MTMMAYLPVPLKRLFNRIDATATDSHLEMALTYWQEQRGRNVFPGRADMDSKVLELWPFQVLLCPRANGLPANWRLETSFGGSREWLVVPLDGALSHSRPVRIAVRLRLLMDHAVETGEPVLGTFVATVAGQPLAFEMLAAPLAEDHRRVDAMFCAIGLRQGSLAAATGMATEAANAIQACA